MPGIFDLTTPADLLLKLGRELERIRSAPDDADHVFNFFVTAEHILDWTHPGDAGKPQRKELRSTDPLLGLVSHIANGAKHFDRLKSHHASIQGTSRRGGYFARGYFARGFFSRGYFAESTLTVALTGEAAKTFGLSISALDLAERVYSYWAAPGKIPS